jgi:hypothetical protein
MKRCTRQCYTKGTVVGLGDLPIFRQRALDVAIADINRKTDFRIEIESLEQAKHRRVTGLNLAIKEQTVPEGDCVSKLAGRLPRVSHLVGEKNLNIIASGSGIGHWVTHSFQTN